MTAQMLAAAAGILLSLLFSYIPKLNTWYAAQSEEAKKLIMLGLLFVIAVGAFGLSCAGVLTDLFGIAITCDKAGAIGLIQAFVLAVIANQGVYAITPQTAAVKAAKEQAAG
jgi:hypothetical protein